MQLLNNILQSGFSFSKEEETLRLKYRLVNAILTFDIVVVSIAGLLRFYYHQIPQGTIDIIYSFSAFVMFILARKYRHLFDNIVNLDIPTIIIQGTDDLSVPHKNALIVNQKIKNSVLVSVDGADHVYSSANYMSTLFSNILSFVIK